MKHKLECYHNAYEHYKDEAYVFAGPACMETFGEIPFLPENKEENLKLSKKQQELSVEFQMKASEIMNQSNQSRGALRSFHIQFLRSGITLKRFLKKS